ncbi:hypothetical protein AK830_g422 [Neonectria ditissima]|uniref:FAD linked oxidase N-terminal domain-containing protein n=1 Tax=Neonectria ditissima TaxID=78410 RepID=A0A0P7B7H3_9HYPO|nr:hypothetical protein AK830_g422 [Neonectria ditissima]
MARCFHPAYAITLFFITFGCHAMSANHEESKYFAPGCVRACAELSAEFGDAFHYGDNDPDFTVWELKQQEARPACRVEPVTAAQVAGGHSTNFDASNSAGGVTIDLHNMDHIRLSDDQTWADLGPGLVFGEAYEALEKHNLTFVGGRYGLAVDNVYEYEVVLSNGTIVTANQTTNPDLYFALRGGGNNFGIVTNFRVRVVPQVQLLSGDVTFHSDSTDQIVDQVYQLTTNLADDTYMCFSSRYAYSQTQDVFQISVTPAYYEPVLKPPVFDALNEIPYESSTVRVDWMSNFASESVAPHGLRRVYATLTYKPSRELHKKLLDIFSDEVEGVKATPGFTSSVVIQALHINAIKAMKERGGNALGVESDTPLNIALLTLGWSYSDDDKAMYAYADRWVQKTKAEAEKMDLLHPWLYINHANHNQDPFSGYGEENKRTLQRIQKSVDPKGVFTSTGLCRGSFKVL